MDDWTYADYVKIIIICSLWYLCSAGVGIIGKIILLDFPYPLTVTMGQLVTISVLLSSVLPCFSANRRVVYTRRYFVVMMMPLALGKFLSSLSTYMSVWRVSVSYTHTVKATLPLFTVVLAKIVLGEQQTLPVYLSLLPIITGVGVTSVTEATYDTAGFLWALLSTLLCCLLNIFSKKCLKEVGYHHLQLLTIINRLAAICFLPVWVMVDLPRIISSTPFMEGGQVTYMACLVILNGFLNMLSNVFAFTILAMVSPLSYSVANATKRIVTIVCSILALHNSVSPLNAVGMLIAVLGVLSYNKAKYEQVQTERRKMILPYVHSDSNLTHNAGVHHMPHSKSDADFCSNGGLPSRDLSPLNPQGGLFPGVTEEVEDYDEGGKVITKHVNGSTTGRKSEAECLEQLLLGERGQDYFDSLPQQLHSRGGVQQL